MAKPTASTNTGKSQIKRQGHTSNNKFGSNPQAQTKGNRAPRDLSVNAVKR